MRINIMILSIMIGSVALWSCSRMPDPVTDEGIISGIAGIYPNGSDDSIKVTIKGPYGISTRITDINGFFKFKGLGNGTYSLTYSKPGYGTLTQYGIQVFGNDSLNVENVRIFKAIDKYKIPEIERILIGPMPRSSYTNCLILKTQQKLGYFPLLFYLSTEKDVNYKKYRKVIGDYYVLGPHETPNNDVIYIDLNNLQFGHGEKIYIIGYVCNLEESRNGFIDRYTGLEALTTLMPNNHTPVLEFIFP